MLIEIYCGDLVNIPKQKLYTRLDNYLEHMRTINNTIIVFVDNVFKYTIQKRYLGSPTERVCEYTICVVGEEKNIHLNQKEFKQHPIYKELIDV